MDKLHIEYFCYDIDDNLLHMPTKINMINLKTGNKEAVSSEKFAEIRNDKENWAYADDAFIEFRDFGPRGPEGFKEDLIYAIRHKDFAPSWHKFILTLENGYLFALITARGNSPQSFRMGVEWIIDNFLSKHQKDRMYNNLLKYVKLFGESHSADEYSRIIEDYEDFSKCELVSQYLDNCDYYGVSNPEFVEKHKSGGAESPEKGKEIALRQFIKKVKKMADSIGARTSIGMSDDDIRNVLHVEQVFKELLKIYPDTIFRLYDTSNRGYKKMVVESRVKRYVDFIKETSEQAPGLESSVLPFTQFGNMTGHLYPQGPDQRQDDFANEFKRKTKYLSKTSKDLLGKKKDEEDEEIEEGLKNIFKKSNPYKIPRGHHFYFDKTISDCYLSIEQCLFDISDIAISKEYEIIENKYLYCSFLLPEKINNDRIIEIKDRVKNIDKNIIFITVINKVSGELSLLFTYEKGLDKKITIDLANKYNDFETSNMIVKEFLKTLKDFL